MNNLIIILCHILSLLLVFTSVIKDDSALFVAGSIWICTGLILTKLQEK